jgi:hypothetical protein
MYKAILITGIFCLSGCATARKCKSVEVRENSVFSEQTCQLYVRNGLYLDQVSPNIANKIKEGKSLKFNWVPAKSNGLNLVPAHAEIEISEVD